MRALNFSVIYNLHNYRPRAAPLGILICEENSERQRKDGIRWLAVTDIIAGMCVTLCSKLLTETGGGYFPYNVRQAPFLQAIGALRVDQLCEKAREDAPNNASHNCLKPNVTLNFNNISLAAVF